MTVPSVRRRQVLGFMPEGAFVTAVHVPATNCARAIREQPKTNNNAIPNLQMSFIACIDIGHSPAPEDLFWRTA
jgi:hypothetical protein